MGNPQLEDGHTRIANEILEALSKTNLSSYQSRLLFAIIRKTYGHGKKLDWIAVSQLVKMTGIKKSHVSRAKTQLIERKIVTSIGNKIGFNKCYSQWAELPKQVTVTSRGNKVTNLGQELPIQGNTKETIQKKYNINTSNEVFVAQPQVEVGESQNISLDENSNSTPPVPHPPSFGNKEINELLDLLKEKLGLDDFKETAQWQRRWGQNLLSLMKKITPHEFGRRLEVILADEFKRKNCNKLEYIHREIKAFIQAPKKQNII